MELALDEPWVWWLFRGHTHVSILVFVELALDGVPQTSSDPTKRVSILVFVELALDDEDISYHPSPRTVVSILVFVELALDARGCIYPV